MSPETDLLTSSEVSTQEEISEIMLSDELQKAYSLQEEIDEDTLSFAKKLKALIKAAQQFDQQAIDELCKIFKPLVYKEARRTSIYKVLGEDAVNMAWVIFLQTVHKYDRDSYLMFPGYAKIKVHYGLLDSLNQTGCLLDCDAIDASEDFADTVVAKQDFIADRMCSLAFKQAYKTLTQAERKVLEGVDFANVSITDYSKANHCSIQNASKLRLSAIRRLSKQI